MRFIYKIFPGFYSVKYTLLGMIATWLMVGFSSVVLSPTLYYIFLFLSVLLQLGIHPQIKQYKEYFGIIGLSFLFVATIFSFVFVNVFQFIGLCGCKSWVLSNSEDPNYPLNVNFFNIGMIVVVILKMSVPVSFTVLLLLSNIVSVTISDFLWSKYRIVGVLRY
jgi:hypothetical protein